MAGNVGDIIGNMQKQIKSKERVSKFGEVFTNEREVKAMCDLVKNCFVDIQTTFLEPCCGNGNFLVEILERKLKLCKNHQDGLSALTSIYGIDIQADNVEESRSRLLMLYMDKFPQCGDKAVKMAKKTLNRNIICADSLAMQEQLINGVEWEGLDKTLTYDFKVKAKRKKNLK